MASIGGGYRAAVTVSVTRVTASQGVEFDVLLVSSGNVGVLAGAGLVLGPRTVRPTRVLGCGSVNVWYQRREGSVRRQPRTSGVNVNMLTGVLLGRQQRGMLGRETRWTVGWH